MKKGLNTSSHRIGRFTKRVPIYQCPSLKEPDARDLYEYSTSSRLQRVLGDYTGLSMISAPLFFGLTSGTTPAIEPGDMRPLPVHIKVSTV